MTREERLEAMVDWFGRNFEDPNENMPYDGREGGYQYIWGGPHEALEELSDAFPGASQADLEEASERIEGRGVVDWAPNSIRVQPEDDDEEEGELSLTERLDALGGQINRIEAHLLAIREAGQPESIGIGHNNPPEQIDDDLTLDEIQASIDDVRTEQAKPEPLTQADASKVALAATRFRRYAGWVLGIAGLGASAFSIRFGEAVADPVGHAVGEYIVHHHQEILADLLAAADTLSNWAQSLNLPF